MNLITTVDSYIMEKITYSKLKTTSIYYFIYYLLPNILIATL